MNTPSREYYCVFSVRFLGGYYTIELAGSRIRLVALNMNLYMEDIMDEMKFRRTDLRGRGVLLKGGRPGDPSLGAVTDPDPMGQWAWLSKVMETAKKKQQNVSSINRVSQNYTKFGKSSLSKLFWLVGHRQ